MSRYLLEVRDVRSHPLNTRQCIAAGVGNTFTIQVCHPYEDAQVFGPSYQNQASGLYLSANASGIFGGASFSSASNFKPFSLPVGDGAMTLRNTLGYYLVSRKVSGLGAERSSTVPTSEFTVVQVPIEDFTTTPTKVTRVGLSSKELDPVTLANVPTENLSPIGYVVPERVYPVVPVRTPTTSVWFWVVLALIILLVLAAVVFFVVRHERAKKPIIVMDYS